MTPRETHPTDAHVRAQRALVQRSVWLLEDSEAQWLATHLEGCASCRAVEADLRERAEDLALSSGHLPSRLVASWERESARLPESVRAHVLAHLRSCEQCREEFTLLGHELPAGVTAPARDDARRLQSFWERLRSRGPGLWVLGGGLATAAAALALYLAPILRGPTGTTAINTPPAPVSSLPGHADSAQAGTPVGTHSGSSSDSAGRSHNTGTRPSSEAQLALSSGGDAESYDVVQLDEPTFRGAGDSITVPERIVAKGARSLGLQHPVAALMAAEDEGRVTIEITTPSGLALQEIVLARDLRADRPLIITLPKGIEEGTYRYAYLFGHDSRTRPVRGEILLRFR